VAYADVLVGAVLIPGGRSPVRVSKEAVPPMRPGAVFHDHTNHHGGSVETSRPTSLTEPVFRAHGALHFCAPNVPALVARTASHALSHELVPLLARDFKDLSAALRPGYALSSSVAFYKGMPIRPALARALGVEVVRLEGLLGENA
jgi:alanine dehydrogenase